MPTLFKSVQQQAVKDEAHKKFADEKSEFLTYLKIWRWFEQAIEHKKTNRQLQEIAVAFHQAHHVDEIIRVGHRNRDEGRLASIQAVFERPLDKPEPARYDTDP